MERMSRLNTPVQRMSRFNNPVVRAATVGVLALASLASAFNLAGWKRTEPQPEPQKSSLVEGVGKRTEPQKSSLVEGVGMTQRFADRLEERISELKLELQHAEKKLDYDRKVNIDTIKSPYGPKAMVEIVVNDIKNVKAVSEKLEFAKEAAKELSGLKASNAENREQKIQNLAQEIHLKLELKDLDNPRQGNIGQSFESRLEEAYKLWERSKVLDKEIAIKVEERESAMKRRDFLLDKMDNLDKEKDHIKDSITQSKGTIKKTYEKKLNELNEVRTLVRNEWRSSHDKSMRLYYEIGKLERRRWSPAYHVDSLIKYNDRIKETYAADFVPREFPHTGAKKLTAEECREFYNQRIEIHSAAVKKHHEALDAEAAQQKAPSAPAVKAPSDPAVKAPTPPRI
jgi:hypothetical protein